MSTWHPVRSYLPPVWMWMGECRPGISSSLRELVYICGCRHGFIIYFCISCLHLYFNSFLIGPFLCPPTQLASPPAGAQSDQTDSLSGLREARQKCPLWLQHDEEGPGGNTHPCESRLHCVVKLCALSVFANGVKFQFSVIYIAPIIVITCRGFTETQRLSLQAGRNALLTRGSRCVCKGGWRDTQEGIQMKVTDF